MGGEGSNGRRLQGVALLCLALATLVAPSRAAGDGPTVGATLPAYVSWLQQIGGGRLEAISILPPGVDPHVYQPSTQDLATISRLDAVVENGHGHDAYLTDLLRAAGRPDLRRIRPSEGTALIRSEHGWNGHSFLSILGASQEIRRLASALGELDPEGAPTFRAEARAYGIRLRRLLATALERLDALGPGAARVPVGTVHDGYAYLFQELGLRIHAVVQPRHGVEPSAKQLADTVERIRRAGIRVLFTEMDFAKAYVDTLYRETGCHIARLSHITGGEPGPERFESDMEANLDAILDALEAATADERRANEEAGAGEGLGGARP